MLPWSTSRRSWQERLSLLALVLAAIGLWWIRASLTLAQMLLLVCLLLISGAILLRQGWLRFVGPMLFYDLVRVARKPRYIATRTLYAIMLALALCWFYLIYAAEQSYNSNRGAEFAEYFFYVFILVQLGAVCILTPAYTAGTIAEEKDRRTLEFILATDLHNREIILSKLLSRLANLLLIVLTGLPILGFLQFMGGVEPNLVLFGYAATALTMLGLASLSILNSTRSRRARDAIALTYFMAASYVVLSLTSYFLLFPTLGWAGHPVLPWFSSYNVKDLVEDINSGNPIALAIEVIEAFEKNTPVADILIPALKRYAVFHGLLAAFCVAIAILRLRVIALKEAVVRSPGKGKLHGTLHPRVGEFPMVWKEVYLETRVRHNVATIVLIILLVTASFVPVWFIVGDWNHFYLRDANGMNGYIRIGGTTVACLLLLSVAARSAGSISSERDRQTLDALLTTPLSSDDILFGKWVGNICSVRWAWLWLGSIYILGVISGGLHPLALMLLVLAWWVYAAAVALIGMWFSITCTTTLRATVWTLCTTFFAGLGHWMLWLCCCAPAWNILGLNSDGAAGKLLLQALVGLTPPLAMGYCLAFGGRDRTYFEDETGGFALLGLFIWALISVFLWVAINERFRAVMGRAKRRPLEISPKQNDQGPMSNAE